MPNTLNLIDKLSSICRSAANSIPLAVKWSVIISCFVSIIMGSLGWYLIQQQTQSFRQQSELLGQMVAEHLSRAASEPLLADDNLTLQVLVSQQEKSPLILGMEIYSIEGELKARAGVPASEDIQTILSSLSITQQTDWGSSKLHVVSFYNAIQFKDIQVGIAVVTIDHRPFEQHLKTLTHALLTTTVGLILIGILLAFPLAYRLAKPIHQLVEAGEALDDALPDTNANYERRHDAIGRILTTFNRMGDKLEQNRRTEIAFSRHLSPTIAREVLNTPQGSSLGGTTIEGSVLFCDIVGFTELSENMLPADVGELLNQYFNYFSMAAHSCEGTIDKFIGDCIMILFGVPVPDKLHAVHALTCAVLIQEIATKINHQRAQQGQPIVKFRLGVNSGPMLAGNLGGEDRMQYTVVGDTVNVASRICSLSWPGTVLATQDVFNQPGVNDIVDCIAMPAIVLKGRKQAVTPYTVSLENFVDDDRIRETVQHLLPQAIGQ